MRHCVDTLPRLTILLLKCEPLTRTSQPKLRRSMSCAFPCTSCPQPCVDPTFNNGLSCDAADDGANPMVMSASLVFLFQNVYSRWTLLRSSCESKPPSNSAERSGLRSALPGWFAVRPPTSTSEVELRPVSATVPGVNSTS